ncbi:MAG: hypothetical protein ACKESB_02460 [Candidatus Hodgkinia cicadicola]
MGSRTATVGARGPILRIAEMISVHAAYNEKREIRQLGSKAAVSGGSFGLAGIDIRSPFSLKSAHDRIASFRSRWLSVCNFCRDDELGTELASKRHH